MKSKMLQGMKKIFSRVMLVAAAAMTFFACQKPEVIVPEFEEVNGLAFSSDKPSFDDETKTQWTGESIQWSAGDKIRVAYTCDGVWQNADGTSESSEESGSKTAKIYESKAITEAGSTAFFSVPGYFKGTAEGVYEFYGIYPSSLVSDPDIKYAPSVTITIPTTQTPTASSFDSAADVMASKSQSYVGIPKVGENNENNGPISLKWERLVAHGHFTIKNLAVEGEEDIQTITLTANAGADMVGTHYLYLDTYNVVKPNSNAAPNSITINSRNLSIDSEGKVTFWASFLPCTWTSIDIKVETDKASYTRKIDLSSNQKTFAKNARNILAINMASAVREVKSSNALPFVKDFSDKTGTNGITELDGFTVSGSVYNAAGAIRLAKADAGGSITTQSLDLSCDFHVKVTASGWDSDELSLIVSSGDQSETVTLSAVGNGNNGPGECAEHIINFQPVSNSSSVTFAAAEGKRCYIKKIEILEGHAVAAPVLKATTPNKIAAEGGEGSFTFTLANPKEGENVTAVSSVDWITNVVVSDGQVTYTVAENTSEEPREGTITLSYEGAQSVNVVITQEGKASEIVKEETIIYQTAFNYPINGSAYNSSSEYVGTDAAGTSWGIKYGNWNGSNCAQLRVYSAGNFGSVYMKFDVANATRVTYKAKVNNTALKLNTYYSTDSGSTWTKVNTSKALTTSLASYEFNISATGEYSKVRIKFEAAGTAPSSSNYQLTIDDVVIYGFENGGGETPEPDEPETPVEPTLTPRNLTFSVATATATVGQAFDAPTLSGVTTGVTYSSSNTAVATVDASTGAVTPVGEGTTTITATAPETAEYEAGTASYTLTVNAAQGGSQQTTTTYTFNSKSWGDSTNSWTSGKDGNQFTSGQGVQVTIGASGANATCKSSFSNVTKVVVKYCTNSSKGAGTIKITVGSQTKTFTVSKSGGTTLRDATFDFSSNPSSGTPKIEVTCTTNSVYVSSMTITHTN